jgi:RNA-binding protein Luc7-like 2
MNKARAMLDSLMGPGRDEVVKDKAKSLEKFKDDNVCKAFLLGFCPYDASALGGKRNFKSCEKIHSEVMKQQFEEHSEHAELKTKYEAETYSDLTRAVKDCEARITEDKARIRDDWGRRRPPLPVAVIDKLAQMKRECSAKVKKAEALDDDKFQEKAQLMAEANELTKECEELEEAETKKAVATAIVEEVCEICGTCYQGDAANTAHLQFKIHLAYQTVRDKIAELKPKLDELKKSNSDKDKRDRSEKRRSRTRGRDRSKRRGKSSSRGRDRDRRESRDRGSRRDRKRSRSRSRGRRDSDRGRRR